MNATARNAYVGGMVSTASPARLLVMLVDRLEADVTRAAELQERREFASASVELLHAQEIVLELRASLDHDAWDGAAGLDTIYAWMHTELVRVNVGRDAAATRACLGVVSTLAQTWRDAALAAASVA